MVNEFPPILAGVVQLWRIDTPVAGDVQSHLTGVLNERERQRAQSLVNPQHRSRFISRRGMLRTVLAKQLAINPTQVTFAYGTQGKPMLCPEAHPQANLHFNLTHSRDVALLAMTRDHQVGVDLEAINDKRNIQGIGERYFHPQEWAHIEKLNEDEQTAAFFDNWACKEAVVKGQGGGIVSGLSEFIIHHVSPTPGVRTCEHLACMADENSEASAAQSSPAMPLAGGNSTAQLLRWTLRTMSLTDVNHLPYRAAVALPLDDWTLAPTLLNATL